MKKLIVAAFLLLASTSLFAQCPYKYGATEEDSLKCLEQMTNFNMFYKAKNYTDAYEAWQYIVQKCPCAWDGIFTNAQTLFDALIKAEKDSARKELLIDSLLYSFEVRGNYFPNKFSKGYCMGFKAYNTLKYRGKQLSKDFNLIQENLDLFIQSVELEKEKTQPAIWDAYFRLAEQVTKATKDTSIVIESYGRATDYLGISIDNAQVQYEKAVADIDSLTELYNKGQLDGVNYDRQTKALGKDTARQMKYIVNYKKSLSKIEKSITPYASCQVLEEVYGKKLPQIKDDLSAVNKIVITMSKSENGECVTSPVFKEALEILHKANPNRSSAYWMGNLSLRSFTKEKDPAELDAAINYFTEAVRMSETNEQKGDANYMLALAYQLKNSYAEARSAAYAALKAQPNMGKAYILIGDLYANSYGRCSGEEIPAACAWAAADKYAKAAAVDPSCAEKANQQRAKLRFPSKEELFKRGINAGSSYHVGCWIQENTTVR